MIIKKKTSVDPSHIEPQVPSQAAQVKAEDKQLQQQAQALKEELLVYRQREALKDEMTYRQLSLGALQQIDETLREGLNSISQQLFSLNQIKLAEAGIEEDTEEKQAEEAQHAAQ